MIRIECRARVSAAAHDSISHLSLHYWQALVRPGIPSHRRPGQWRGSSWKPRQIQLCTLFILNTIACTLVRFLNTDNSILQSTPCSVHTAVPPLSPFMSSLALYCIFYSNDLYLLYLCNRVTTELPKLHQNHFKNLTFYHNHRCPQNITPFFHFVAHHCLHTSVHSCVRALLPEIPLSIHHPSINLWLFHSNRHSLHPHQFAAYSSNTTSCFCHQPAKHLLACNQCHIIININWPFCQLSYIGSNNSKPRSSTIAYPNQTSLNIHREAAERTFITLLMETLHLLCFQLCHTLPIWKPCSSLSYE